MTKAILFDLGNTLAEYYESCAYPELLSRCIGEAAEFLARLGLPPIPEEELGRSVDGENFEHGDHRVRALEGRLLRIFRLRSPSDELTEGLCRAFMKPIFDMGKMYDDTIPFLQELRRRDIKIGVVSNAPWGCPASLCHEEAVRLGLPALADAIVFCTDIGWRKPAREIFEFALNKLGVTAEECLFVGDHPEWDLEGPRRLGMKSVLLDRRGTRNVTGENVIRDLRELTIPGLEG